MTTFPHLPSDFYEYSESLRRVRQAAFSRQVSPDSVLAVVLCRVSASLPPGIVLPEKGTLDFIAALVGESGTGKSKATGVATDLLPDIGTDYDGVPIGSGEGIAGAYVGKVDDSGTNPPLRTSALFYVDEGSQLLTVSKREGSITANTMRSGWSGETFGTLNASADRKRIVKRGTYRFALAVGLQPVYAAELLTGKDAGDPQRYLFAGVTHPDIPDDVVSFPEPIRLPLTGLKVSDTVQVDGDVMKGIRKRRAAVSRGEVKPDPLDSHRDLLTLKVAALLSHLTDESGDVTADLWELATCVVDNGRNVRDYVVTQSKSERDRIWRDNVTRDLEKDAMRDEHRERRARHSMARSMIRKAKHVGKATTRSILATAVSGKHRNVVDFDDALDFACEYGTDDGRLRRDGDYFVYVPAA